MKRIFSEKDFLNACMSGNIKIVKLFIEYGYDANIQSMYRKTFLYYALELAKQYNHKEIIEYLESLNKKK